MLRISTKAGRSNYPTAGSIRSGTRRGRYKPRALTFPASCAHVPSPPTCTCTSNSTRRHPTNEQAGYFSAFEYPGGLKEKPLIYSDKTSYLKAKRPDKVAFGGGASADRTGKRAHRQIGQQSPSCSPTTQLSSTKTPLTPSLASQSPKMPLVPTSSQTCFARTNTAR